MSKSTHAAAIIWRIISGTALLPCSMLFHPHTCLHVFTQFDMHSVSRSVTHTRFQFHVVSHAPICTCSRNFYVENLHLQKYSQRCLREKLRGAPFIIYPYMCLKLKPIGIGNCVKVLCESLRESPCEHTVFHLVIRAHPIESGSTLIIREHV